MILKCLGTEESVSYTNLDDTAVFILFLKSSFFISLKNIYFFLAVSGLVVCRLCSCGAWFHLPVACGILLPDRD